MLEFVLKHWIWFATPVAWMLIMAGALSLLGVNRGEDDRIEGLYQDEWKRRKLKPRKDGAK